MTRCPECGQENEGAALACAGCGANLETEATQEEKSRFWRLRWALPLATGAGCATGMVPGLFILGFVVYWMIDYARHGGAHTGMGLLTFGGIGILAAGAVVGAVLGAVLGTIGWWIGIRTGRARGAAIGAAVGGLAGGALAAAGIWPGGTGS